MAATDLKMLYPLKQTQSPGIHGELLEAEYVGSKSCFVNCKRHFQERLPGSSSEVFSIKFQMLDQIPVCTQNPVSLHQRW